MTTTGKRSPKGKPYHSVLAPFAAEIFIWQQGGKTYQEIADLLSEKGVLVHRTTIWHWVAVRAKGGGRRIMLPDPSLPHPTPAAPVSTP